MRKKINLLLVFAILFSHMAVLSPAIVHAEEHGVAEASVGDFVVDTAKEAYKRVDEMIGDFAYDVLGIGRDPRNNPRQQDKSRSLGRIIWDQMVDREKWAKEILGEAVMGRFDGEDILDFLMPIWRTPKAGDETVDVVTGAAPDYVDMRVTDDFIFAIGESITAYNNEEWRFVDESFTYIGTIDAVPGRTDRYNIEDTALSFIFPIRDMNPAYRIQFRAESNHPFQGSNLATRGLQFDAQYEKANGSVAKNSYKWKWTLNSDVPYTDDYLPDPNKHVRYFEAGFDSFHDDVHMMTSVGVSDLSAGRSDNLVVSVSYRVVDEHGMPVESSYGVDDNPFEAYTGMTVDDIYNELRERFDADEPIRHYVGDEEDRENVVPIYNDDGSAGPGFFGSLIGGIVDVLGKLLEAVLGLSSTLLNVVIDAFTAVIGLIIPNAEQIQGFGDSFANISDTFTAKFSFVTDITEGFKNIFSPPIRTFSAEENIFTKEWTVMGQSFIIVHPMLYSSIENVRTVLSSMLVIFTFVSIYKRIVGSGDVIK